MAPRYRKLDNGLYMKYLTKTYGPHVAIGRPIDTDKCISAPWNFEVHNPSGPAFFRFNSIIDNKTNKKTRYKSLEIWRINGELHREGGPARTEYNSLGQVTQEQYYQNGVMHNDFGPAWYSYRNGELQNAKYFIKDKQIRVCLITDFLKRWDLTHLSELADTTNAAAYSAFIMEFY